MASQVGKCSHYTKTGYLKNSYRVRPLVPTTKEVDANANLDRDENKLDAYLTVHKGSLLVSTLYIFLPFTISLDPQLRKDITGSNNCKPSKLATILLYFTVLMKFLMLPRKVSAK